MKGGTQRNCRGAMRSEWRRAMHQTEHKREKENEEKRKLKGRG